MDSHEFLYGIVREVFILDLTTCAAIYCVHHINFGKHHDVSALDEIEVVAGTVYVIDKAPISTSHVSTDWKAW